MSKPIGNDNFDITVDWLNSMLLVTQKGSRTLKVDVMPFVLEVLSLMTTYNYCNRRLLVLFSINELYYEVIMFYNTARLND
jgi:hypothetical protein